MKLTNGIYVIIIFQSKYNKLIINRNELE